MSGLLEEEHDPPEESLGDEPCAGELLEGVALLKDAPVPSSSRLIVGPFLKVAEALGRQHVEAVRKLLIGLLLQATGRDDGVAPELEGLMKFYGSEYGQVWMLGASAAPLVCERVEMLHMKRARRAEGLCRHLSRLAVRACSLPFFASLWERSHGPLKLKPVVDVVRLEPVAQESIAIFPGERIEGGRDCFSLAALTLALRIYRQMW